jgi:hypothetical protein
MIGGGLGIITLLGRGSVIGDRPFRAILICRGRRPRRPVLRGSVSCGFSRGCCGTAGRRGQETAGRLPSPPTGRGANTVRVGADGNPPVSVCGEGRRVGLARPLRDLRKMRIDSSQGEK